MEGGPGLFIGLFCWAGALLVYLTGYRSSARRCDIIAEVPTIAARDVPGLGAAMVEVKGFVRCAQPVVSDLARSVCVTFECSVTENWTTTRTERDSKGNTRTVTEHHSESRYSNSRRVPFDVQDMSGCVRVEPEGASMDLLDSLNGWSGPLPESPAYGISPRHFGGSLQYAESVLPLETEVYVLGQVGEHGEIVKATDVKRPYIISYRSEESLLNRARWGKRIYGGLMLALFIGGCIAILYTSYA